MEMIKISVDSYVKVNMYSFIQITNVIKKLISWRAFANDFVMVNSILTIIFTTDAYTNKKL